MHCWCHVSRYWDVFLVTFPDFLQKGAPHASAVKSDWIEGRALQQSTKKRPETEEKSAGNRRRTNNGFRYDLGSILGGFGNHFGSQNAFKTRLKFWMRFWRSKNGTRRFFWVGQAECAGPVGRIMEGYKNLQKRQGGDKDQAKEI